MTDFLYDDNEIGEVDEIEHDWDDIISLQAEFDRIAEIEDPIKRLRAAADLLEGKE